MRFNWIIALVVLVGIIFTGCKKWDKDCYDKDKAGLFEKKHKKDKDEYAEYDKDGKDKVHHDKYDKDKYDKDYYTEHILVPLEKNDECDCIVKGKVKYVSECGTEAIVDYGDGTCDNIATKTVCYKGDCDHSNAYTEEFEFDCKPEDKDHICGTK